MNGGRWTSVASSNGVIADWISNQLFSGAGSEVTKLAFIGRKWSSLGGSVSRDSGEMGVGTGGSTRGFEGCQQAFTNKDNMFAHGKPRLSSGVFFERLVDFR